MAAFRPTSSIGTGLNWQITTVEVEHFADEPPPVRIFDGMKFCVSADQ
ncbi:MULTISPECIES: hypothetical protein [Rhizobium]|nr:MULTISPECIES: hypothetical protein [Rhizobium]